MKEYIIRIPENAGIVVNGEYVGEIVRCKYCIHSRPDEDGLECMVHYRPTKENDFCNYGE